MVFEVLSGQHTEGYYRRKLNILMNEPRSGNVMGFYCILVRLIIGWYIRYKSCLSITKSYAKNSKGLYTLDLRGIEFM